MWICTLIYNIGNWLLTTQSARRFRSARGPACSFWVRPVLTGEFPGRARAQHWLIQLDDLWRSSGVPDVCYGGMYLRNSVRFQLGMKEWASSGCWEWWVVRMKKMAWQMREIVSRDKIGEADEVNVEFDSRNSDAYLNLWFSMSKLLVVKIRWWHHNIWEVITARWLKIYRWIKLRR